MNLNSKRFKLILLYSALLLTVIVILPMGKTGADTSPPVIDISVSPAPYLFELSNLKPGDWATRTLIIQNQGNQDFTYLMKAKRESGSEKLYNQLLLQVNDSQKTLYDGKLSGYEGIDSRALKHSDEEKLEFTVKFPDESGNEYQGVATEVAFHFQTDGTIPANPPADPATPADPVKPTPADPGTPTNPAAPTDQGNSSGAGNSNAAASDNTLPKTGESNPLFIMVLGFLITASGVTLLLIKRPHVKKLFNRG
ncbi:LPXTG cell wall anchor domain-containing protein [Bacillus sp. T33-2]|uniref:LPXTG cell wall anchor domain-containing protein n=1 Tax=Bacillus sp. T33-2 TaxID=2054168 RepID=UPI000C765502|nr:LPXTG cell wall anchor domain-containing protein [Bacillus sp. T33-2]PLR99287.1 hypothetical protein CVD19_02945 [Bacillus sp. T33-2]